MYLIDSDVFIDAANRHYSFDIVPAFWDWISKAHLAGKVFTVDQVVQEIITRLPISPIGSQSNHNHSNLNLVRVTSNR